MNAHGLGLGERAVRDALAVVVAAYEFHGGFRLRTTDRVKRDLGTATSSTTTRSASTARRCTGT